MDTCQTCTENFNKTSHLKVSCPFCAYDVCKTCAQTYIVSTSKDPHCMNCKHEHNREFVDSFCTKKFRNTTLRKHRENVLFEREQARLPETQPYVERELNIRSLRRTYIYLLFLLENVKKSEHIQQSVRMNLTLIIRKELVNLIDSVQYYSSEVSLNTTPRIYIQKCLSEECRGFLSDDYKCGVCKMQFCENCHETLTPGHVCDKNTVKTIKLIKRDTKPCPKCNTMIHKIDGCAQMWCTQCHTAFDWRTGCIETGRIHNPHYVAYFKNKSREHCDIPCGGRPNYNELKRSKAPRELLETSLEINKLDRELMIRYGYIYDNNLYVRMRYILNEMTENEFKRELQRRDKFNDKITDIQDIYRMVIDTIGDLLRRYMIYPENVDDIIYEIIKITTYANETMDKIRKRYISKIPYNIMLSFNK